MKKGATILATLVAAAGLTGALCAGALAAEGDDIIAVQDTVVISVEGTQYTLGKDTPLLVDVTGDGLVNDADMEKINIKIVSVNGNKLTNVGTQSGVLDNQDRTVLEYGYAKVGCGHYAVRLNYHAGDDPVAANRPYAFESIDTFKIKGAKLASGGSKSAAPTSVKATYSNKKIKVTCAKMPNADSFAVQVYKGTKKVKSVSMAASKPSVSISGLSKGTYKVRVAAREVTEDLNSEDTTTVTGKWSNYVTVKVK